MKVKIPNIKVPPPGPKSLELHKLEKEYLFHIWSADFNHRTPFIISEVKDSVLKDVDGNAYIDFATGFMTNNIGHLHPRAVRAAKAAMDKLGHVNTWTFRHEYVLRLAEKLAKVTPGNFGKKLCFGNSGSEAVEAATMVARVFKKRTILISFFGAYHGRTMGTLSLAGWPGSVGDKKGLYSILSGAVQVPFANCYRCEFGKEYPDCDMQCVTFIESVLNKIVHREDVAGILLEPFQGNAGVAIPPIEFMQGLKRLCEENDLLFIVDEVQTGLCRTGKWFAIEHYDIEPDLMCLGKALSGGITPISAVVGRAEIMETPGPFFSGTFVANPISCAAGLEAIKVMEEERLDKRAARLGERVLKRLLDLKEEHRIIGVVNGRGLYFGGEIVEDKETKKPSPEIAWRLYRELIKRGVVTLMYPYTNLFRLGPSLTMPEELLDRALGIIEESVLKVEREI